MGQLSLVAESRVYFLVVEHTLLTAVACCRACALGARASVGSLVATWWLCDTRASVLVAQGLISCGLQALEHSGFSNCGAWA